MRVVGHAYYPLSLEGRELEGGCRSVLDTESSDVPTSRHSRENGNPF